MGGSVRLVFALLFMLCLLSAGVQAEEGFIRDRSYLIGEVAPSEHDVLWKPFEDELRLGYGDEPVWIKLLVAPLEGQHSDDSVRINVAPGYLDQIEMLDPLLSNRLLNPVGDRFPITHSAIPGLTHNFMVPVGVGPRTIYFKIRTSSSRLVQITAARPDVISRMSLKDFLYSSALLVIAFALCGGAIYNSLLVRDAMGIKFAVLQMLFFLYTFFILGFGRFFLSETFPSPWIDAATTFFVIVFTAFTIAFYIGLFREYLVSPRCCGLMLWVVVLVIGCELAFLFWKPSIALMINSNMAILASIVFLILSVRVLLSSASGVHHVLPSSAFLFLYFLFVNFINIANFLQFIGLNLGIGQSFYGAIWNGIFSGGLLLFLMHYRNNQTKKLYLQEINVQQIKLDIAGRSVEELGQVIDLIAHEVRTPMTMISFALDGDEITKSRLQELAMHGVSEIQELLTRCSLLGDLNNGCLSPILEAFSPKDLLENLIAAMSEPSRFKLYCVPLDVAKGDVGLLRIVVRNLLENAIKYGAIYERVRVMLRHDPKRAQWSIEVTNRIGAVGAPDLNLLFERHYRSPKARRMTGSGLGLYLSKKLMRLQGGDLVCEISGDYIRFCLTVPMESYNND